MMIRTKFCDSSMTLGSLKTSESARLSNRVDGHQVSAPERPTRTSFWCFFALARAWSSWARPA